MKDLSPLYPAPQAEVPESPLCLIVPGTTADTYDVHVLFRRKFHWEPGKKLLLHIASHGNYRFEFNGSVAGIGPARGTDFRIFYDSYDLTAFLRSGENELVIQYHYAGSSYRTMAAGRPAVWVMFAPEPDGSWEYAADPRTVRSFEYTFQLGRCEDRDDRRSDFRFVPAETAVNPNQVKILPRPVPPLTREEYPFTQVIRRGFLPEFSPDDDDFAARMRSELLIDAPEAFDGSVFAPPPAGSHGAFAIFDLGREFYGNVEIELECEPGVIVDRAYDEMLILGRVWSAYFFGKWAPRARHAGGA